MVKLSPVSTQYIDPMDINPDYADDEDPLTLKSDFMVIIYPTHFLGLCIRFFASTAWIKIPSMSKAL